MPLGVLVKIIAGSEVLMSILCGDLSTANSFEYYAERSLGCQMAQFIHLSQIQLSHFQDLDLLWTSYACSGSISHITYTLVQHLTPQVIHLILGLGIWKVNTRMKAHHEPLDVVFDLSSLVDLELFQSYILKSLNLLPNF